MKNLIIYKNLKFLFIFTLVLLTACGSAPNRSQTEITPSPEVTVSTPTTEVPIATPMNNETNPTPTNTQQSEQVKIDLDSDKTNTMEKRMMNIQIGETVLSTTLVENSSVDALIAALSKGPITINMRDYGSMEKVGSLGMDLPRNDQQITTEPGDVILYQGNALVIYYAPNSWNFTRLGKIDNVNSEELREILGQGDVTITLSLQ